MKNVLKVGEVAEQLKIKKSLIRQWKQQFDISPHNPFYTPEDVAKLQQVSNLLKSGGLSVNDVKAKIHSTEISASQATTPQEPAQTPFIEVAPQETQPEIKPLDNASQIVNDITLRMLDFSKAHEKAKPVQAHQERKVTPAKSDITGHKTSGAAENTPSVAPEIHMIPTEKHDAFMQQLSIFKQALLNFNDVLK
jgi:DNA-binding transcriptional MerR regulator